MVFLIQNCRELNNELSSLLRVIRTRYQNEIKLHFTNVTSVRELKLNVLREDHGYYKFLFIIKIPRDYPYEPMWAEPVIVCKQMISHFPMDDFKSHKLRTLVDNVLHFCQKYEAVKTGTIIITFPSMGVNRDEYVASKVFILLNKTLVKLGHDSTASLTKLINSKAIPDKKPSADGSFYNNMAIKTAQYVNTLDKCRNKYRKQLFAWNHKNEPFFGKVNLLLISVPLTVINKRLVVECKFRTDIINTSTNAIHLRNMADINHLKLCFSQVKDLVATVFRIPIRLSLIEFRGDWTIEFGDDIQIHLKMLYDSLIIHKDLIDDFIGFVNSTFILSQTKPYELKNNRSFTLLSLHCREMVSMSPNYNSIACLLHYFTNLQLITSKKVFTIVMSEPVPFGISEEYVGLLVEDIHPTEIIYDIVLAGTHERVQFGQGILIVNEIYVCMTKCQTLIKERYLLRKGDMSDREKLRSQIYSHSEGQLRVSCTEIIGDIIRYPSQSTGSSEFILDLDPLDSRHRILLECIGLLRHKHVAIMEIMASTNYNINHFFVKEIVSRNGDGYVIRLYKLPSQNIIFNLIKEENDYYKGLMRANRAVWCMARISEFSLHVVSSLFTMASMYLGKLRRHRLIAAEAFKLKCTKLPICRCNYNEEFIESLTFLTKSHQ